jgi:hypothetical protein
MYDKECEMEFQIGFQKYHQKEMEELQNVYEQLSPCVVIVCTAGYADRASGRGRHASDG